MKNTSGKDPSELERLGRWVDGLISFGFALGVLVIVGLFVYVLVTQFLTTSG